MNRHMKRHMQKQLTQKNMKKLLDGNNCNKAITISIREPSKSEWKDIEEKYGDATKFKYDPKEMMSFELCYNGVKGIWPICKSIQEECIDIMDKLGRADDEELLKMMGALGIKEANIIKISKPSRELREYTSQLIVDFIHNVMSEKLWKAISIDESAPIIYRNLL